MTKNNLLFQLNDASLGMIREVGEIALAEGMKAYLVGGPVRDLMLGIPNIDLDVTVEGNGMHIASLFAQKHQAKLMRYPAFKTATVTLPSKQTVDFATTRKEIYPKPGMLPIVTVAPIEDDLHRRDFTINAMAIAINPDMFGKMIDPYGGRKDLLNKHIRILHDDSFIDDPTRLLRAVRFSQRLGFDIEQHTRRLMQEAIKLEAISTIKIQRYNKEYTKILKEQDPKPALQMLRELGLIRKG